MKPHWSWFISVGGVLMLVIGAVVAIRRAGFAKRKVSTTGTVAKIGADSSGEWPIVRFVTEGGREVMVIGRNTPEGTFHVGDPLPVDYDPENPTRAEIRSENEDASRRSTVRSLLGMGAVLTAVGVALAAFAPHLDRRAAARDRALSAFLEVVRRGDLGGAHRAAAPHAKLDEAFLKTMVRTSTAFNAYGHVIDAGGCVEGTLAPSRARLVAKLVETNGGWKVLRIGPSDPECDEQFR